MAKLATGLRAYSMPMSDPASTRSPASTLRRGTLALLAFWLLLAAVLYAGFSWREARQRAALRPYTDSGGQLVIPRQKDGHFYVPGEVNRQPVNFLVDTGASAVAVTDALARAAGLPEGSRITVSTAGGLREARRVHGVPVRAGPLTRNDVTVTVGLHMNAANDALLGESFLRYFDVQISADRMVLRPR
jgi:aspartyl protease family protein